MSTKTKPTYETPQCTIGQVSSYPIFCISQTATTEEFDDIEDIEW